MTDLHDAPAEPMPEELFIAFANGARIGGPGGTNDAADAVALRRWLDEHALARGGVPSARLKRELPAFRELRSLVRGIAARRARGEPPTRVQVAGINRAMRDGLHFHALRPVNGGSEFRMEQVGDDLDQARSAVAGSLAHYLADHDDGRLRVCADDACGWLFIDRSPAGRRRWCDMRTCGNRAKVARHRARARRPADGGRGAAKNR